MSIKKVRKQPAKPRKTIEAARESALAKRATSGSQELATIPEKERAQLEKQLYACLVKKPEFAQQMQAQVGGGIYRSLLSEAITDADGLIDKTAATYAADVLKRMAPRDPLEELFIQQMLWTHARLAYLSSRVVQNDVKWSTHINEAAERAANLFRRQMLALSEYRNPRRGDSFIAVKQANLAQQQVVQNVENRKPEIENATNEQGLAQLKALPAHASGTGIPAIEHPAEQALAVQHRPQDGSGQGEIDNERPQTR